MALIRANTNNPAGILFNNLNDTLAQIRGLYRQAGFSKHRIDSIYDDIFLQDHYETALELGHATTDYDSWALFHDAANYSIWKYPVSHFADSANNLLTLDDEDLDNRRAASSESYVNFTRCLRYHANIPVIYSYDGTTYTKLTNPSAINLGTGMSLYLGYDYPPPNTNFSVSVAGSYTSIALEYSYTTSLGWGWQTLTHTDETAGLTTSGEIHWTTPTDFTSASVNSLSKYWVRITATTQVTQATATITNVYYDDTVEATSEKGTKFPILNTTSEIRYLGSNTTFTGASFRLHTGGKGYTLKVEYLTATGWTDITDNTAFEDDTDGFVSNGNFTLPTMTGWISSSVANFTAYWLRITTTTTPTALAWAYKIDLPNSVISLLRLSNEQILLKEWAWCYYGDYVYVTIPNTADGSYEGDVFITGDSTSTNLQNYFIHNHEYQGFYLTDNYRKGSCHNVCRVLNSVDSKVIIINSSSVVLSSVDVAGNWTLKGSLSSGSSLMSGAGYLDHEVNLLDSSGAGSWYFKDNNSAGIWEANSAGNVYMKGTLTENGAPVVGTNDYTIKIPEAGGRVMLYNCTGKVALSVDSSGNGTILGEKSESYTF